MKFAKKLGTNHHHPSAQLMNFAFFQCHSWCISGIWLAWPINNSTFCVLNLCSSLQKICLISQKVYAFSEFNMAYCVRKDWCSVFRWSTRTTPVSQEPLLPTYINLLGKTTKVDDKLDVIQVFRGRRYLLPFFSSLLIFHLFPPIFLLRIYSSTIYRS